MHTVSVSQCVATQKELVSTGGIGTDSAVCVVVLVDVCEFSSHIKRQFNVKKTHTAAAAAVSLMRRPMSQALWSDSGSTDLLIVGLRWNK